MRIRVQSYLGQECTETLMRTVAVTILGDCDKWYSREDPGIPHYSSLRQRYRIDATLENPPDVVREMFYDAFRSISPLYVTLDEEFVPDRAPFLVYVTDLSTDLHASGRFVLRIGLEQK